MASSERQERNNRSRDMRKIDHPNYNSWFNMVARCTRPHHPAFKWYGGRGIKVCKRWLDFEAFCEDMGDRPQGLTLDRINGNRGYFKSNCRWVTQYQQTRNTSQNVFITYLGRTLIMNDWADELGIARGAFRKRRYDGWSIKRMIETPPAPNSKQNWKAT